MRSLYLSGTPSAIQQISPISLYTEQNVCNEHLFEREIERFGQLSMFLDNLLLGIQTYHIEQNKSQHFNIICT